MSWPEISHLQPLPPAPVPRIYRVLFWLFGSLMAIVALGGILLPDEVDIQRTRVIPATPAQVYDLLAEPAAWDKWAPWFQRDPFLEKKPLGEKSGPGARLAWRGKEQEGRMMVTSAMPVSAVRLMINVPEHGELNVYMDLKPVAGGTEVTWGLHGEFGRNYGRRYHGLFYRGRIGDEIDAGLNGLTEYLRNQPVPEH